MEVHGLTAAAGTGHGHGLRSLGEGTREVTGTPGTTAVWRSGMAWEIPWEDHRTIFMGRLFIRSSRHWNDGE